MVRACKPCDGSFNKCRLCQGSEPNGWWSPEQVMSCSDVKGKTYMITGANTGIGFVTAQSLLESGAKVIITTRSAVKTKDTISRLIDGLPLSAKEHGKERVVGINFDLGSLSSIEEGVKQFNALGIKRLDAVCFNAGVMAIPGFSETVDGLEMTWGVNHVGHFHLFKLLLPTIEQLSGHTRIVVVSSIAHQETPNDFSVDTHIPPRREDYEKWQAYGVSKLSNILMAKEIAKRFDGKGISAYALHPGFIAGTSLYRHMPSCFPYFFDCCSYIHCCCLWFADYKSVRKGASTQLFLMSQPLESLKSGGYYAGCRLQDKNSVNYKAVFIENDMEAEKLWEKTEEIIAEKLSGM